MHVRKMRERRIIQWREEAEEERKKKKKKKKIKRAEVSD